MTTTQTQDWSEAAQDDLCVYSDLHKDVYGFRPRNFSFASEAEFTAEFKRLAAQLEVVLDEERAEKIAAAKVLKARLRKLMADHGVDAVTALKWDFDAMDCDGRYDWGEYAYTTGVGYKLGSFLKRKGINTPAYSDRLRDAAEDMRGDYY